MIRPGPETPVPEVSHQEDFWFKVSRQLMSDILFVRVEQTTDVRSFTGLYCLKCVKL